MKQCKNCGDDKELNDFYYNKKGNYYDGKCKICRNKHNKKRRLNNKNEINKKRRIQRNTPEEKLLRKSQTLLYKYNITIKDYEIIYTKQNGLCGICNKPKNEEKNKYFNVDHDHITGNVRGLLCSGCNAKLGWFESYKDNILNHINNNYEHWK